MEIKTFEIIFSVLKQEISSKNEKNRRSHMVSDFKRIGLLIVTIIIAVVSSIFLSGLSYESRPNDYFNFEVHYGGSFNATVVLNNNKWDLSGFGYEEKGLYLESFGNCCFSALVKKLDGDTGVLLVYLRRKDRTIIFSDSTSEPYGEIKIYFTLDEVQYLLSD
jgi:hypothetical protein